jgi:hypothetical protein
MSNIFSRVIAGIIGLVIGGVLNALIGLIPAYLGQVPKGQIVGYEVFAWIIFPFVGFIIGACVGMAIGVAQFKLVNSLALGTGITFLLFLLFLGWIGGGDMGYPEGRKGVYFIFSIVLLDGCFISFIVCLVCNALTKLYFRNNLETNSNFE